MLEEVIGVLRSLPIRSWRGKHLHLLYLPATHLALISEITAQLLSVPGVVAVGPLFPEASGSLSIPIRSEGLSLAGTESRKTLERFNLHWGSITPLGPNSMGLP